MERKLEVGSGGQLFSQQPGFDLPQQQWSLFNHFWTVVPVRRNGTRQPLICVLVVKSK